MAQMKKTAIINARIAPDEKAQALAVLDGLCMSVSDALRHVLAYVAAHKKLPEISATNCTNEEDYAPNVYTLKPTETKAESDETQDGAKMHLSRVRQRAVIGNIYNIYTSSLSQRINDQESQKTPKDHSLDKSKNAPKSLLRYRARGATLHQPPETDDGDERMDKNELRKMVDACYEILGWNPSDPRHAGAGNWITAWAGDGVDFWLDVVPAMQKHVQQGRAAPRQINYFRGSACDNRDRRVHGRAATDPIKPDSIIRVAARAAAAVSGAGQADGTDPTTDRPQPGSHPEN